MRTLTVGLLLAIASDGYAAQYITQAGDTIHSLAHEFGHTPYQIQRMNSLELVKIEEPLVPGVTIEYITEEDVSCARMQIEKISETATEKDRLEWEVLVEDLNEGVSRIHYLPTSRGLVYYRVLAFARQWRQSHPPGQ